MADCGELEYQLIEQVGSRALSTAKLLRAEINSINKEENTANITLLDTCEEMIGIDLTAVPFWYHCEFSTGTIEDLAFGHKAFAPGEMVYVVHDTATVEEEPLFYIIGHVDIHGTAPCSDDYLVLKLGWNNFWYPNAGYLPDEYDYFVTIFDVKNGETLDLDAFEEIVIEGGSPKPESFPCRYTTSVANWINNNFKDAIQTHSCPITVTVMNDDATITGNVETEGCDYSQIITYSDGSTHERYTSVVWSDLMCEETIYPHYASIDESMSLIRNYTGMSSCIHLIDGVTSSDEYIYLIPHDEAESSISSHMIEDENYSCIERIGEYTCSNSYEYNHNFNIETPFSPSSISIKNISASFTDQYEGLCEDVLKGYYEIFCGLTLRDNAMSTRSGTKGFYTIICFAASYAETVVRFDRCYQRFNVASPCYRPDGMGLTFACLEPSAGVVSGYSCGGIKNLNNELHCLCTVSMYEDVPGDRPYEMSPFLCINNKNADKSTSLENTVSQLQQAVYAYLYPMSNEWPYKLLYWAMTGVDMKVYNKKYNIAG